MGVKIQAQGARQKAKGINNQAQGARPKVKVSYKSSPFALRLLPCALTNKGFTLIELLIVLVIIVLGFSVVAVNISSGSGTMELKAAARDIVSALRFARGRALMTHQETTFSIDLGENSYTISGRDKTYAIPEAIEVTVVTAQSELTGEGQGNIRFFADGSSSGGRITLERGDTAWQIDINWLTGQIKLEDEANP